MERLGDKITYYKEVGEENAHYIILEVEGEIEDSQDLLNLIEELEFSKLSSSHILDIKEFAKLIHESNSLSPETIDFINS